MLRQVFAAALASLALLSFPSFAIQPAVPLSVASPFRFTIDPVLRTDFNALNGAELSVDFAQRLGAGFEWGASLHGGAASRRLFVANEQTIGVLGLDVMGRYFGEITPVFHVGIELDLGYTQNLSSPSSGGSALARLSLPFVMRFEKSVAMFIAPGIQSEGSLLGNSRMAASTFGQAFGANLAVGLLFYTEGPGVFVAARPGWQDVRYPGDVSADFTVGLVIDL
jgi:hypothetical protein